MNPKALDCIIVGGGPAGLLAGLYLARFRRSVAIFDHGKSRANLIHRTCNVAGFPLGISGPDLLVRMTDHVERYGAELLRSPVEHVAAHDGLFQVETTRGQRTARRLLLSTGVVNHQPAMENHDEAVARGLLRYCPICDGCEDRDKRIVVIGNSERSLSELEFLRTYSKDVTLLAVDADAARLFAKGGVRALSPPRRLWIEDASVFVELDGSRQPATFDVMYAFLGVTPGARLAAPLGVALSIDGGIVADAHQRTNVEGVYAAGDVVKALDQINVAVGHAAIAATAIHNSLRAEDGN